MTTPRVVGPRGPRPARGDIVAAAQLACLLEAGAPKPGNVSPGRPFADLRYEDFLGGAAAIGEPLAAAGERPLGATILAAVEATGRWTRSNANLGIVLLLAPLVRAAMHAPVDSLRAATGRVLAETTVEDARDVYAAIRLVAPGGLGRVDDQDVAEEPTVTLLEAMRLAADRDGVAAEYASGFAVTFELGAPTLLGARAAGLDWDDAIVETFLTVLAAHPDSHVARRAGRERAEAVSQLARETMAAGPAASAARHDALERMDAALRDAANGSNPGTTADLTTAAIFATLLAGAWR